LLRLSASVELSGVRLRLDGSLSGKWVDEVHREVSRALLQSEHVTLDCRGVSYADSKGVAMLQSFPRDAVTTVNCSGFLQQLSTLDSIVSRNQTEDEDPR
jgi:ABC-type transporter Mla MlaB component